MIKIHPNVIVGNLSELQHALHEVTYIINCSPTYSQLINHPNYFNLNINNINHETLNILIQVCNFINSKILLNHNIFLLCDTGIGISLMVGIFFLMQYHNINYNTVYHNIAIAHKINPYEYYLMLIHFEPYILKFSNESMDMS